MIPRVLRSLFLGFFLIHFSTAATASSIAPGGPTMQNRSVSSDTMDMMGLLTPPGIMIGQAGQWMVGDEVSFEEKRGNLTGRNAVSAPTILGSFNAAPTDMEMQMHMAMAMYAPTDHLTLTGMIPVIQMSMNHVTATGARFTERTRGIGDAQMGGLYSVYTSQDHRHRFLLNFGIGLPTGSIDESMGGMRLEYPMQLGSGTFSALPGITYLGEAERWTWGAKFASTLRLGINSHHYRLGDRYESSVWVGRQLTSWMGISASANGMWWQNIHGADPVLDPLDEPTKNPALQGGKRLDLLLGMAFQPTGNLKGNQFFIQAGIPVVQSLDGPQLRESWQARLAWQLAF